MEINKIHLGDAYELIKQVPSKSVDLIVTDPPYEFNGSGMSKPSTDRWYSRKYAHEINESNIYQGFNYEILDQFVRVMKQINIYLWCSKEQVIPLLDYFVKEKGCKWEMVIWNKTNPSPFFNGTFLNDKEYCLYFAEKGVKLNATYETSKTIYVTTTNKGDKEKYDHPTIKPEKIIENLIRNSCGGGLIFDPFVGSGTTCAVAKRLGFDYLGFEINEKWWRVANDRLEGITQKEVKLGYVQGKLF